MFTSKVLFFSVPKKYERAKKDFFFFSKKKKNSWFWSIGTCRPNIYLTFYTGCWPKQRCNFERHFMKKNKNCRPQIFKLFSLITLRKRKLTKNFISEPEQLFIFMFNLLLHFNFLQKASVVFARLYNVISAKKLQFFLADFITG